MASETTRPQAETRTITVSGQRLRVAIRKADGTRSPLTPLLLLMGYQQVDALGVSWGGALAQQFAFQYPARCRRLILVSTGTGALMVPGNPSVLAKIATPRRYQDPAYMAQIAGEIYGGKMRTQPELAYQFARTVRSGGLLGYFSQMLGGVGWTSIFWLRKLRQPTLILHGDDDPLVPLVNAKIMHRLIPHSKLYIFHDGHLGLGTSAQELAPVVDQFLSAPVSSLTGDTMRVTKRL